MGLFSGKTVISVASSVYNLAGDPLDRPNYLNNLVLSRNITNSKNSFMDTFNNGYLNGPGTKYKTFFKWAASNYHLIGMPTGNVFGGQITNTTIIADTIPKLPSEQVWIQTAWLGSSDYFYWAEQWILRNYPDQLSLNWDADFDDNSKTVFINLPNGVSTSFVASDFIGGARYIYAYYTISGSGGSEPTVIGSWVYLDPEDAFPSMDDYDLVTDARVNVDVELAWEESTVITYSDDRPEETSSSSGSMEDNYLSGNVIYSKTTFIGNDPATNATISNKKTFTLNNNKIIDTIETVEATEEIIEEEDEFGDPVFITVTTTVTRVEEVLVQANSYREDNQKVYNQYWKPIDLLIYRVGSGNALLDSLVDQTASYGQFYPMVPIRLDNKFLHEIPGMDNQLALAKKAFKKATNGGNYQKIVDQIASHEKVGDMDYVYVCFGVSLNTLDNSAKKYLYTFFRKLMLSQSNGSGDFNTQMAAYNSAYAVWLAWRNAGAVGPEPGLPSKPSLPYNEIQIASPGINFDMRLSWHIISEHNENGQGRPGARQGDLWLQHNGTLSVSDPTYTGEGSFEDFVGAIADGEANYDITRVYWQYENNKYRYLDIIGLKHKNFVYSGKNVEILAKDALAESDESGFIVPLHYDTYRSMSIVDITQITTVSSFLVFNVYEVKKQKWWQTGFFKIIFFIAIAVISVLFTGGAGIGLLGAHMAVGASLGLTGMTAAIAGAIANALAALVVTSILTKLTENMGIFGAVISAVLGIVLTGAISNFQNGLGFSFNFADLMKVDNIMKITDAVGKGYQEYIQSAISGMQDTLNKLQETANAELKKIQNTYLQQFGDGNNVLNPMTLTNNSGILFETPDTFLSRTLMSGSDVAAMSHSMLNDYVDLTLALPNAFS